MPIRQVAATGCRLPARRREATRTHRPRDHRLPGRGREELPSQLLSDFRGPGTRDRGPDTPRAPGHRLLRRMCSYLRLRQCLTTLPPPLRMLAFGLSAAAGPSAFHPETLFAEVARRAVGQEEPPDPESVPRIRRAVEAPVPRVAVCSPHIYGHRPTPPCEPLQRFFPTRLRVNVRDVLAVRVSVTRPAPLPSAQHSAPSESQGAASEGRGHPFLLPRGTRARRM
jgi:hypothetical protein